MVQGQSRAAGEWDCPPGSTGEHRGVAGEYREVAGDAHKASVLPKAGVLACFLPLFPGLQCEEAFNGVEHALESV